MKFNVTIMTTVFALSGVVACDVIEQQNCYTPPVGYVVAQDKWSPQPPLPECSPVVVAPLPVQPVSSSDNHTDDRSDVADATIPPDDFGADVEPDSPAPLPDAQSSAAVAGTGAAAIEVRGDDRQEVRTGGGQGASATEGNVSISVNAMDLLR